MVRIDNFPLFVTSKAVFDTKYFNAYGTEWYITISLYKYCQTRKGQKRVTSSSVNDQPETLGAFVYGTRSDRKECSFDVDETFKFKRPSTALEVQYSHKFSFGLTKHFDSWGSRQFARIDVILILPFFCQFFDIFINFRIFWTSTMAIWQQIIHLKYSSMYQFLSVDDSAHCLSRNELLN